jgi:hypothetical protein
VELIRRELKRRLLPLACLLGLACGNASAGDYVLEIDGQKFELDLDHSTNAVLGGKPAKLLLRQNPQQIWRNDGLSFEHPAEFAPARRTIEKNVIQTTMSTPTGSVVLVQHYIGIDPTGLIDFMVKTVSDEEVKAGYTRTTKPASRKLANGSVLSGTIVHTEHPGESWDREIVAIESADGGYLVVGMTNDSATDVDHAMLDLFWHSLSLPVPPRK